MDFIRLYFSFNGRICRQTYWLYCVLPILVIIVLTNNYATLIHEGFNSISDWVVFVFNLFLVWPLISAKVKRLHDINRSGTDFLRILFVPGTDIRISLGSWFVKGTKGSNRFGPDPLIEK